MLQLTVFKPERSKRSLAKGPRIASLLQMSIIKYTCLFLAFVLPFMVQAQNPVINSFNPSSGSIGASITIKGSGFNATLANNIVYFGAVRGIVTAVNATTDTLIATVPAGATFGPISVTTGSLTAYSGMPFTPSFAACNNVVASDFGVPASALLPGAPNLVLNGDIDGDKIPDLVTFNKINVSIHRNTTAVNAATPTNFVSTRTDLALPAAAFAFGGGVADFDGDGKLDIIATGYTSDQFYVFRNISTSGTISFGTRQDINMPPFGTNRSRAVTVGDFNSDGKPDLAFACVGSSSISIYLNTSTAGAISFTAAVTFNTYNGPWDIANADLDGDGKTDLIISCNSDQRIVVYLNSTTPFSSSLSFSINLALSQVSGGLHGVAVGDLNGDGKPDIATLNNTGDAVHLYRNTSSGTGAISFDAALTLGGGTFSGKISLGDLNGDTKPDVVAGGTNDKFYFFTNNSPDNGALSFSAVNSINSSSAGGNAPTSIAITDLNRDGRSDFVAANNLTEQFDIYFNSLSQLVILNVSKDHGIKDDEVELTGTGMGCATGVTLGGVPATLVGTPTANNIKFIVPPGSGSVIISVKTNGGAAIAAQKFTYVTKPSGMKYTPDSVVVVLGSASLPYLTPTANFSINTGGGDITYTLERINGSLAGVPITILTSGQIRALSSILVGIYKLRAIAENTAGKDTAEFVLNVLPGIPSDFEYPNTPVANTFTVNHGTSGSSTPTISWNGQTGDFSISPVPAAGSGITFDATTGQITWNGTVAATTYNFTVTAKNDNHAGEPSVTFKLIVAPLAPTAFSYTGSPKTEKFGKIDSTAVPGINWHGKTGNFTITTTGLPSAITVNPVTGVIRWNKGVIAATDTVPVGTYVITVKASNTVLPDATASFTLIVEAEKPTDIVYTPMPLNGLYGDGGSSAAPKVNWHGDIGTFQITSTSNPAIVMPDAATGVISWPTTLAVGTHTVKLKAKNIIDFSDEYVYTLIISAKAPTGLAYDNQQMMYENSTALPTVTSPKAPGVDWHNGGTGTFSYISPNTGISVDATTGVITWKDTISVGVYSVRVTAQNNATPGTQVVFFTLTVKAEPPVLSYDPKTADFDRADSSNNPHIDWNGNTGSFVIVSVNPASATSAFSLSTTNPGRIKWNKTLPIGNYIVTVRATNSAPPPVTATFSLTIAPGKPSGLNYASHPATANYNTAGNSGAPTLESWHGDIGSFENTNAPLPSALLKFDSQTGIITWDAGLPAGTYTIKVRARNLKGLSDDEFTYTLTIKPLAPTGFSYPDGGETRMYLSTNTVSRPPDIDWQGVSGTFKIDPADYIAGLPATIVIDPVTGIISWPNTLLVKKYNLHVIASNGIGTDQVAPFYLLVTAGPASGLDYQPDFANIKYGDIGGTAAPAITWFGEEGSFTITSPSPKPKGIDVDATGAIKWDGTAEAGVYILTIKAANSNTSGSATDIFTLTVKAEKPSDLLYSQKTYTEDAGVVKSSVQPTVKWHGETGHFEIVPQVTGFTVDADGLVSWAEDVLAGTYTINVKAVNTKGESNVEILTITLNVASPSISYSPNPKGIEFGKDGYSPQPTIKWHGEIGTVGISGIIVNMVPLPTGVTMGITIDPLTGILHFPATLAFGDNIVVFVTASNGGGQGYTSFNAKVGGAPKDLVYLSKEYTINEGTLGQSLTPTVDWNGVTGSFVMIGQPAGVSIENSPLSAKFGQMTWAKTVAAGTHVWEVYADNGIGTTNHVTITLVVNPLPTATITGGTNGCAGVSKTLSIAMTGTGPWTINYSDGTSTFKIEDILTSPYSLIVSPTATTTYTLVSVQDANSINTALNTTTGKTTITINTTVTALINNGAAMPAACNQTKTYTLTASGGGAGGSYLWSNNATTAAITVTTAVPLSADYTVTVKDAQGCTGTATVKLSLNTTPAAPVLSTPGTNLICDDGSGTSGLIVTASGAATYTWSKNSVVIAGATASTYKATTAGTYTVAGKSAAGCASIGTSSVVLKLAQKPIAKFEFDSYCKDQPVHFTNTTSDPSGDAEYTWHFGDSENHTSTEKNPVFTYTKAETVLMILVAKSGACPDLLKTQWPVVPTPITIETAAEPVRYEPINALKNRASTIPGRAIGEKYAWTPGTGLSSTTVNAPKVTPLDSATYQLKITTKAGCVTVDTQLVRIFSRAEIFVPKGFTPNGDGMNDRLFPIAVGINELHYFKVFNRWGVLMYETKTAGSGSANGGWDGTFKGTLQPMDSYTWIAEAIDIDGQLVKISGSSVLIR
jgi:gliding motility-associated-like protein